MGSFIVDFWAWVFDRLRWISWFQIVTAVLPSRLVTYALVEGWVLANLMAAVASLVGWSVLQDSGWGVLPIVWGGVRVVEIFVYQANVLLFDAYRAGRAGRKYALRGYRRLVILALHNYVEVTFWFAVFYRNWSSDFEDKFSALKNTSGALYYSLVTMTTLGYGEIVPREPWAQKLVAAHLAISIFLTLTIIARFISFLPQPPSLEEVERKDA